MTRKDYVAIAAAIALTRDYIARTEPEENQIDMRDGAALAAEHIANVMAQDNPRFDRQRFLKACGVQS